MVRSGSNLMTEEEFKQELAGSLLLLSTSSPDKRNIFREYFSSHALTKDKDGHYKEGGINVFFTDSGAVKLPPRKTPERKGTYEENLAEKYQQQVEVLKENDKTIRNQLVARGNVLHSNKFDPDKINIIGMTEDSGWKIDFKNLEIEKQFVNKIIEKLKPKIREKDAWLLEKLHGEKEGFPGPNLKPFQEHLAGGFSEMMDMIYDTAKEMGIERLRFKNFSNVAFASPRTGKVFLKNFESSGDIITCKEYQDKIKNTKHGEAINSNFIHIPDGQAGGARETIDSLIKKGLHNKSQEKLPAKYARRDLTEYLQGLIGKRKTDRSERKRHVGVSFINSDYMDKAIDVGASIPAVNDYTITGIPHTDRLRRDPHLKTLDDTDVVVLVPEKVERKSRNLHDERNYRMLTNFVTTTEVDPQSMGIPLVLDNRGGAWDRTLKLFTDEFAQGRIKGEIPFYVANTDKEMRNILVILKDIKQRAPLIKQPEPEEKREEALPIEKVPNDGVFTLFVAGGHANNSKRDLEDAKEFGYHCAKQDWRIITGGGSLEGSMGSIHTGFIQYHLDNLQETKQLDADIQRRLSKYKDNKSGKYDAEKIILRRPDLLEILADKNLIPRDRFVCYSMKPLLEMESPSGDAPPATRYIEAGNRVRRLDALLASGTKVFLPGSIGTDEELAEAIKQRVDAVSGKNKGKIFSDGTPDNGGAIILYNRNHHLDNLLEYYGLTGMDGNTVRKKHNIIVVGNGGGCDVELLKQASDEVAETWLERVKSDKNNVARRF